MTGNGITSTVVRLWEDFGLSISQIAQDQNLEESVVKSILVQHCPKYNKDVRENTINPQELISDEEFRLFVNEYKGLIHCEDNYTKERVIRNLINLKLKATEGLGIQKAPSQVNNQMKTLPLIGVISFNERLAAARKAKEAIEDKPQEDIIDVEAI